MRAVRLTAYGSPIALPTVIGNEGKAKCGVAALPSTHSLTTRGMPREEAARG